MPVVEFFDWRRSWAHHLHPPPTATDPSPQSVDAPKGISLDRTTHQEPGHADVGRVRRTLSNGQLPINESAVVMPEGRPNHIVLRYIGLNDHFPTSPTAAGPPSHLSEELKGPLRRPEVR